METGSDTASRGPMATQPGTQADERERVLLGRIAAGEVAAFEAFYKLYYPRLSRFILRTTCQPDLVEELLQETMLLVWTAPDRFNDRSKVSTWVFGIAYHKAIKAISRIARRALDRDIDEFADVVGDPTANLAERCEAVDWLVRALDSLSADQRAIVELTFYHGLSYEEIAQVVDCPLNTVKTRMFHARRKIQALARAEEE